MTPEMMRGLRTVNKNTVDSRITVWRTLLRTVSCVRFDEVLVLQGTPLLGAIFAMGHLTMAKAGAAALLAAGSCCLVAHVFLLNDWSGMTGDLQDPNRAVQVFLSKGVRRLDVAYLWMALLVLSLLLLSPFGPWTLLIATAIASLSAFYSAPGIHMKGVPLLNSILHFAGGLMHFLLGYSVFRPVDGRGLEIGCFFALIFVAGHLMHEARDHEADLVNGIKTNAVTFGKPWNFAGSLALFTAANVLLFILARRGTLPSGLAFLPALYPLQLYWSLRALRTGLTFESIRWLQLRYRLLYAVIGLIMSAAALFG